MQRENQTQGQKRRIFEFHTGRKFWVLIYIVPWFVIGFLTAIFLSKSSSKRAPISLSPEKDPNNIGFSWNSLPWQKNSKLSDPLVANFPISIHGNLEPEIERIYKNSANISSTLYTSITSSCVSSDGFVVHSNKEYPESSTDTKSSAFKVFPPKIAQKMDAGHPWFPKFSLSNYTQQPRSQTIYPRLVSLPQPKGMDDHFFLTNIFPLLFILPEGILQSSVICFTRLSPALKQFFQDFNLNFRVVTSEQNTVCAEEVIIPKLPEFNQVPQTANLLLSDYITHTVERVPFDGTLVMRDGDPNMRRREVVTRKLTEQVKNVIVMNKKWSLTEQLASLVNTRIAVGFGGDQLNFATFMPPGSTLIEVQRNNVVSRPVLVGRALGLRVHVIPIKDGDIISDDILKKIISIISSL